MHIHILAYMDETTWVCFPWIRFSFVFELAPVKTFKLSKMLYAEAPVTMLGTGLVSCIFSISAVCVCLLSKLLPIAAAHAWLLSLRR